MTWRGLLLTQSHRAAAEGSALDSVPAYAASVLADGALQGVSKRVGEEDDLPKVPKVTNGYCLPAGMVLPCPVKLDLGLPRRLPGTQQSHSHPR